MIIIMSKGNENLNLKEEKLRKKYGDTCISVIPKKDTDIFDKVFTPATDKILKQNNFKIDKMESMLRYKAEIDPSYKQPIPYVIFTRYNMGEVFCMKRIGGDSRLIGNMSLGVGGHIDGNESIKDAMYREIEEEIGIDKRKISSLVFKGYICENDNAVSAVHLGIVYIADISSNAQVTCQEDDKLLGSWISINELENLRCQGKLETWSEICFDSLLSIC